MSTAKPAQAIIYGLVDPKSNELRYVGTTTQMLTAQLDKHLSDGRSHPFASWLSNLKKSGLAPEIFEIESVDPGDDWYEAEQFWATYFRGIGADLLNMADGIENRMPLRYRTTMGLFATGVTIILAGGGKDVHGMTANGVTSLSLEPSLIIVCPSKKSCMASYLKRGQNFTVNILGERQETLANYFARGSDQLLAPKYEFVPWAAAGTVPRLGDCIGALACRVHEVHEGGDHWIIVGEVVGLYNGSAPYEPLLFFSGGYHSAAKTGLEHLKTYRRSLHIM